jgi:hypothetical protein
MTTKNLIEIISALNNDDLYDYIASNYYKMSKEELKNLLLEYIYIFYKATNQLNEISALRTNELNEELIQNIKERF